MIQLHNLNVFFGVQQVLHDISLTMHPGETLALVGASGCGKSTLAKALLRLLPAHATITGTASFQGQELLALSARAMRRIRGAHIALVSQDALSALNPTMRIGKQIVETLRSKRTAKECACALLKRVGLEAHHYFAYPHQLSGGMRQRALIAMALARDPKLLIADEPTTALDPALQQEILALLKSLQRERAMSLLLISHDLQAVRSISDRVHVMHAGRIVERGATAELFSSPQHPYTQELLRAKMPVHHSPNRKRGAPLMRAHKLCKHFTLRKEIIHPLQGADIAIHPGEILGIVGTSGAGKSTLARLLLRLDEPTSGHIFFETQALHLMHKEALRSFRKQCQMIFQDPASSLNPRMRVKEIVCEPLRIHAQPVQRTHLVQTLERVGLDEAFLERYPHELSGGQRQRVSLARALVLQPRLLICDEALSMLDAAMQVQIAQLLKQLSREQQLAILFIAHDMHMMHALCDRVATLHNGLLAPHKPMQPLQG